MEITENFNESLIPKEIENENIEIVKCNNKPDIESEVQTSQEKKSICLIERKKFGSYCSNWEEILKYLTKIFNF